MLSGIDSPITSVGRRVVRTPLMAEGLSVRKNANTTVTASASPIIASRSSVSICWRIEGPSLDTVTISTPAGSGPISSSASSTPVVTSMVLASGSLTTDTPMLGLPLVRDMLVTGAGPIWTSATSPSVTGMGGGSDGCGGVPGAPVGAPEKPTTRFLSSSRDSYVLVVLIGSTRPPSLIAPPGNVTLFSLSAWDTWNIETRFSSIFSESTEIRAWRSTVPATSTAEHAVNTLDCGDDKGFGDLLKLGHVFVTGDAELQHREGVRVDSPDDRLNHAGRELDASDIGVNRVLGLGHVHAELGSWRV